MSKPSMKELEGLAKRNGHSALFENSFQQNPVKKRFVRMWQATKLWRIVIGIPRNGYRIVSGSVFF